MLMTAVAVAEPLRLGRVEFAATGAAEAQSDFQQGVAALHSFWYDEALAARDGRRRLAQELDELSRLLGLD